MQPATHATQADRRCRARRFNGTPCGAYRVHGAVVCRMHGGAAPQVKRKARERLLAAADPAAAKLVKLLESDDEMVALRATVALLDRAGYGPSSTQVQVDGGQVNYQIEGVPLDQL